MKVEDVMTPHVKACFAGDTLESIARTMWEEDCGAVPVIDSHGHPIGMVTDRDIAMSAVLNHKDLWDLHAHDVIGGHPLYSCHLGDEIQTAIDRMAINRVRRLPVVNGEGHLAGIVTFGDLISAAGSGTAKKKPALSFNDLAPVLRACCEHHRALALR